MVRGHGPASPKVFLIGDSPHGADFKTNYALSGWTANMLNEFCREQGLHIEEMYRTCIIKDEYKPSPDKDIADAQTKTLLKEYGPLLIEEINGLQPNLLIPLGEISFNFLTGLSNIRKFRGSVLPLNGPFQIDKVNTKVLPILGPYPFINADYRLKFITRVDFSKIRKNQEDVPIPDNLYNIWVARSSTALRAFLDRSYDKAIKDPEGFLVFDIETYLQIPICISFCFDGFESVCIPLLDKSIDFDVRVLMLDLVAKVLASPIPKVNQNIKYDWRILERWGFSVNNIVGDSMLAASTLYCEFPKNLGFLTSIYTDLPYFKDEGKSFDPDRSKRDRYYLYNAKDSLAVSQIYRKQLPETVELGTNEVYTNLIKVMPIYKKCEDRGIRIDEEIQDNLLSQYTSYFNVEVLKAKQMLNRQYFNPLSSDQCRKVVYDELGYHKIRGIKTTKSGEPSTDEESLELLQIKGNAAKAPSTGPAILDAIIGARKFHKVIEILELHKHPDRRFRCEFNLTGTKTGRTSAGSTTDQYLYFEKGKIKVVDLGHSLQTIGKHGFMVDGRTYGKDLRSMFVPSYGFRFVEIDQSGAEARVDRILSGNYDMHVFENPGIHRLTGSLIYDCKPEEIKKGVLIDGVDRYHMSKTVRHSAERNITSEGLMKMTQRPVAECEQLLLKFHKAEPNIRKIFHKQIINAIDSSAHCLVAPNGRRMDFFGRITQETYNEGISFIPQAVVSDQTKFKGILPTFSNVSINESAFMLAEMHDGVLAEVKIGKEYDYIKEFRKNIEVPINFEKCTLSRDFEIIIPVEASIGDNWYDMEDVK